MATRVCRHRLRSAPCRCAGRRYVPLPPPCRTHRTSTWRSRADTAPASSRSTAGSGQRRTSPGHSPLKQCCPRGKMSQGCTPGDGCGGIRVEPPGKCCTSRGAGLEGCELGVWQQRTSSYIKARPRATTQSQAWHLVCPVACCIFPSSHAWQGTSRDTVPPQQHGNVGSGSERTSGNLAPTHSLRWLRSETLQCACQQRVHAPPVGDQVPAPHLSGTLHSVQLVRRAPSASTPSQPAAPSGKTRFPGQSPQPKLVETASKPTNV